MRTLFTGNDFYLQFTQGLGPLNTTPSRFAVAANNGQAGFFVAATMPTANLNLTKDQIATNAIGIGGNNEPTTGLPNQRCSETRPPPSSSPAASSTATAITCRQCRQRRRRQPDAGWGAIAEGGNRPASHHTIRIYLQGSSCSALFFGFNSRRHFSFRCRHCPTHRDLLFRHRASIPSRAPSLRRARCLRKLIRRLPSTASSPRSIQVLDGPLTITGPVTPDGNGWASITAPLNGVGILIEAGTSDNVILRGIAIDGAGVGAGGGK